MALTPKQLVDFVSWLRRSPLWADDGILKLYLHCLEKASHNHYDWRGLHLQPGDLPLSEVNTAQALNWSRDKLRRRIRLLEATGLVSLNTTPGVGTVLHMVGWHQNDASDTTGEFKMRPVWPHFDANSTDDSKMGPGWLHDSTGVALFGESKTEPERSYSDDDHSKTGPERSYYDGDHSKMSPLRSYSDDDHSQIGPERSHHDATPQTPIGHNCQQNHTTSCKSGPLIIQEQLSDHTGRAQTCPDDIQYPYNQYNTQYNKPNILPGYGTENEPVGFTDIWLAYPQHRRTHRGEAASLVEKALHEGATIGSILAALEEAKQSMDWQNNGGQYVPGIVKWLQRESWRRYLPEDQPDDDEGDEPWVSR